MRRKPESQMNGEERKGEGEHCDWANSVKGFGHCRAKTTTWAGSPASERWFGSFNYFYLLLIPLITVTPKQLDG